MASKIRNIKQLTLFKIFILIREWFRESQINTPEHIDETIFYLGQGYAFLCQNSNNNFYSMEITSLTTNNLITI